MTCYLADGTSLADGAILARGCTDPADDMRMFYDESNEEVFISYANKTYILTPFGLGSIDANIRDGFYSNSLGLILHSEVEIVQGDLELCSDVVNTDSIGLKGIEFIALHYDSSDTIFAAIDTRTSKKDSFLTSNWKEVNGDGAVKFSLIGIDFKLRIRVPSYTNFQLSKLSLEMQFRDKRYRRGIAGNLNSIGD